MKRRSRAGGKPIKGQRPETPVPKPRHAVQARAKLSPATEEIEVARLTRELSEERQKQATDFGAQRLAVSEVLRAIANSPHDLQPIVALQREH